ncbi:hypothetical protein Kim5_PA00165 (plasmid) [Rhizobium sp. Kim5]|nr:hypothetical protein Kim5_PA00165 [Rhizobium sp. Kim5]
MVVLFGTTGNRMTSIGTTDKPFRIEKRQVYEAYKAVKANRGAAGWTVRPWRCLTKTLREISTRSGTGGQ